MIKQEEIREGLYELILNNCQVFEGFIIKKGYTVGLIMEYLHDKGVVIKADRELPEFYTSKMPTAVGMHKRDKGIDCGFYELLIGDKDG